MPDMGVPTERNASIKEIEVFAYKDLQTEVTKM